MMLGPTGSLTRIVAEHPMLEAMVDREQWPRLLTAHHTATQEIIARSQRRQPDATDAHDLARQALLDGKPLPAGLTKQAMVHRDAEAALDAEVTILGKLREEFAHQLETLARSVDLWTGLQSNLDSVLDEAVDTARATRRHGS